MDTQSNQLSSFEFCHSLSASLPTNLQVDDAQKLPRVTWPTTPSSQPITISLSARDFEHSGGDFHAALRIALERATKTRWRVVCCHLLSEREGQSRTLVVKGAVLRALLRRLLEHQLSPLHDPSQTGSTPDGSTPDGPPIHAELHAPLTMQNIQRVAIHIL